MPDTRYVYTPLTPPIPLVLDKPRGLRLDKRAIFQAEREMSALWGKKQNILTIFSNLESLTLNDLAVLLHQGLLHEDPDLTLEQVQDLMDFDRLPDIFTALLTAWNAATQSADPTPGGAPLDGPLSSPGVSFGPSPVLS